MQCVEIPVQFTAGLTFAASVTGAPAGAVLTLHLRGPGQINLTADADGKFSATATDTSAWVAGTYWWVLRATLYQGDEVHELDRGDMIVRPDLVAATGVFDGRSENEKALAAIEAVIAKRATIDQQRYKINNRELERMTVPELLKLRGHFKRQVRAERNRAGGGRRRWGRAVPVQFA